MQAYKCEDCGKYFDGRAANKEIHEYLGGEADVYQGATLKLSVVMNLNYGEHDLCDKCTIKVVEMLVAKYKKRRVNHAGREVT